MRMVVLEHSDGNGEEEIPPLKELGKLENERLIGTLIF
jgi:hypothetical protein